MVVNTVIVESVNKYNSNIKIQIQFHRLLLIRCVPESFVDVVREIQAYKSANTDEVYEYERL